MNVEELLSFAEPVTDNKHIQYISHKFKKIIRIVEKKKYRHNFFKTELLYKPLLNYADKQKYYLLIIYRCSDGDYWVEYTDYLKENLVDVPEKYSKSFFTMNLQKVKN